MKSVYSEYVTKYFKSEYERATAMTKTVTGAYESATQIKNAQNDLIAIGIPQEQIFVDDDNKQIKVIIADETEPEIEDILKQHDASSMSVTTNWRLES